MAGTGQVAARLAVNEFFVGFGPGCGSETVEARMNDLELLREYVEHRSERAFAQLVRQHLDLVHSAALRVVGDAHLAQDVAQMVFIGLAHKAHSLPRGTALAGWLYRSAWLSALAVLRTERRRQDRERKAMEMAATDASGAAVWETLGPCLDEAMSELDRGDQDALVLRFFERQSLREVGQALGLGEDAAQKRVSRAVEKLRAILAQRGLKPAATVLGPAITANALQAAPAGLAAAVTGAALAKVAAPASGLCSLHKPITLAPAKTAVLTVLVGVLVLWLEGHHLHVLRAERRQLADGLAQAQKTLAGLHSQEAALRQQLARSADAIRRSQARASAPAVPTPSELPAYVRVPKDLLARSKLGWLTPDWQLTPLLVQVLGMRPEEVVAVNQALSAFVREVQAMQERRVTPSPERTLGAEWWRTELQSREFKSFTLSACTNELAFLRTNLLANLGNDLGVPRAGLLAKTLDDSLANQAVLLGGKAGLLTFVRPAKPSDPVIANDRSSTMLLEARAWATLPPSIHQVVESWWDLTESKPR